MTGVDIDDHAHCILFLNALTVKQLKLTNILYIYYGLMAAFTFSSVKCQNTGHALLEFICSNDNLICKSDMSIFWVQHDQQVHPVRLIPFMPEIH